MRPNKITGVIKDGILVAAMVLACAAGAFAQSRVELEFGTSCRRTSQMPASSGMLLASLYDPKSDTQTGDTRAVLASARIKWNSQ
jgi:hypothetical protein